MSAPSPAPRGRPRIHLDDAERHRAFRERRQAQLDRGDIARQVLANPDPRLLQRVAEAYLASAPDKELAAQQLQQALNRALSSI